MKQQQQQLNLFHIFFVPMCYAKMTRNIHYNINTHTLSIMKCYTCKNVLEKDKTAIQFVYLFYIKWNKYFCLSSFC